ncbi:disintegrin and metalloproteinase domain-containing protein 10 isoform X2 [Anthonomus grandis grandis]|uniref:disintegrin and metalloproteinase domain-containing protein 10 isoform X2 n=1 Tax=Anthonomus grandis grandis TaxID=2921223 RepID=UPI002165F3FD|nr:disintegrin and metalloproteinase domain-containing protein 10 isoform X2 [Anthonomus grandis grandis]XP_050312946.1 disintegrin and metalloproteinase domain-containing protein 10 isoform X2 [Anthonomus grandis grandis]XP_050312947.1 disintegrin and metalloproteinase domain-containing protein 10 isoform X2 [Anthonomus grandis grandis]
MYVKMHACCRGSSIMLSACTAVFLSILFLLNPVESANQLNRYISHYEPLSYDVKAVHQAHLRSKRSLLHNDHVHLSFKSHDRHFRLRLKRDVEAFGERLEIHGENGPIDVDTSHIYKGYLIGEPKSEVFGSIIDGVFEGKIVSSNGSFYVEKAHHYFPHHSHPNRTFHSVIYHEDHVHDPFANERQGHSAGCGINDEVIAWMESIQNSAVPEPYSQDQERKLPKSDLFNEENEVLGEQPSNVPYNDGNYKRYKPYDHVEKSFTKYTEGANRIHGRHKRAARKEEIKNTTCSLYIQTDPLIWRHIRETFPEHTDPTKVNEVNEKTREEILSLIAHHVNAVNFIYRDTKFDGRSEHRNIKFEVQRIKIDDDSSCRCTHHHCEMNQFCHENIDVSNFLNIHSLGNHEDFCLAYVFTYRDFTGGTLGLAWVASANAASGGICEKYKTYTETIGGMYQSTKRSLNTGIITFVNYNSRVPPKVSQLTLAHEIGHNFGSPHDYPLECRPGGTAGNFIMFASATSGDRPNNSKFSSCSISNISSVLDAIHSNKQKKNCFKASAGAFCGNKIVEAGEECDCGYDDNECRDKCCYPRYISAEDRLNNPNAVGCRRRDGAQCSPSQGPCCDGATCRFISSSQSQSTLLCKPESDCSRASFCNGSSAECPNPQPKRDKTRCNNDTQLCIQGECAGSICLEWNLQACSLTSQDHPDIDKRKLCELACQNGTDICRSTSEFADKVGLPFGGISLRPGSPCDNYQGYCDVFLKCRAVDADGPLVRLMNFLLDKKTLSTVAQWVTVYWWAVLLLGVAFIIFMGLFIKCCAVHTPSSNPKKPPARRISDTLRRPMNTLRRMRYHHGGPGRHQVPVPQSGVGRNRPERGGRPAGSQTGGPRPGYGEGRGHYQAPKGKGSKSTGPSTAAANYQYAEAYEMRNKV